MLIDELLSNDVQNGCGRDRLKNNREKEYDQAAAGDRGTGIICPVFLNGGTLIAQARAGSATGSGAVNVNAGTFAGRGTVGGLVTLGTGTGSGCAGIASRARRICSRTERLASRKPTFFATGGGDAIMRRWYRNPRALRVGL